MARQSKSQRAYEWILAQLRTNAFVPGYRLVLADIAGDLEMSVVPVREAIRRLEAEGRITYEPNVGARVAVVEPDQYVWAMQTLAIIEGAATALAAPHLRSDDLDKAEAANARLGQLLSDFDPVEFSRGNRRFHEALFGACPNPELLELVRRTWGRLSAIRESTFLVVPGRAVESVREHNGILALLRAGAPAPEVEQAVRDHRWRTIDAFLAAGPAAVRTPNPKESHA